MIFIAEVITVAKGTLREKMICSHELMAIFGNDEKSEPGDNVLMAKRAEEAATGCSVHQTELAGLHVVSIYSLSLWPREECGQERRPSCLGLCWMRRLAVAYRRALMFGWSALSAARCAAAGSEGSVRDTPESELHFETCLVSIFF